MKMEKKKKQGIIFTYLKDYKKECVCAPLFKMLEAMFELFVPLVVASMIDRGIGEANSPYIVKMGGVLFVLAVVGLTCSIIAQYFAAKAATGTSAKLRHALFSHIQSLSFSEVDTIGTSTLITRMTSDINQIQNGINMFLRLFLRSPFVVFGAMIMAFTVDVKAALVFVVTIPLLAVVIYAIMFFTMPYYKKVQNGLDTLLGHTRENLTGARVIRAFRREEDEIEKFERDNESLNRLQKAVGKISGLTNPITYIIINAATAVLIWQGAIRVNIGYLTQGEVVALVNYMSQILVELIKLANLIVTITKAVACGNRVQATFDISSSMEEKEDTKETGESTEYAVEFCNVNFRYDGASADALSGIDFKVKRGDTVGIIGGTGSGKSSVVHLIPRFYDASEGCVRVDGCDVRDYRISDLRARVGMVLQKAVLFHGTIRDNMRWGKEDATDEEIWEALKTAQAEEFVRSRRDGLDEMIEQEGKNLSGGQRQRLTIARALVRKPDILILDDSASALDFATDAALRKAIRDMDGSLTTFIVSQRASSIMYANQIIVLEDGKIAGHGTHDELIEKCDVYKEIYYSQFEKEENHA